MKVNYTFIYRRFRDEQVRSFLAASQVKSSHEIQQIFQIKLRHVKSIPGFEKRISSHVNKWLDSRDSVVQVKSMVLKKFSKCKNDSTCPSLIRLFKRIAIINTVVSPSGETWGRSRISSKVFINYRTFFKIFFISCQKFSKKSGKKN
jgi:hypothetical protein